MQFEERINKIDNYNTKLFEKINQLNEKDQQDARYNFNDPYSMRLDNINNKFRTQSTTSLHLPPTHQASTARQETSSVDQ